MFLTWIQIHDIGQHSEQSDRFGEYEPLSTLELVIAGRRSDICSKVMKGALDRRNRCVTAKCANLDPDEVNQQYTAGFAQK